MLLHGLLSRLGKLGLSHLLRESLEGVVLAHRSWISHKGICTRHLASGKWVSSHWLLLSERITSAHLLLHLMRLILLCHHVHHLLLHSCHHGIRLILLMTHGIGDKLWFWLFRLRLVRSWHLICRSNVVKIEYVYFFCFH